MDQHPPTKQEPDDGPNRWRHGEQLAEHFVQRATGLNYTAGRRDWAAMDFFVGAARACELLERNTCFDDDIEDLSHGAKTASSMLWAWIRDVLRPNGYAAVEQLARQAKQEDTSDASRKIFHPNMGKDGRKAAVDPVGNSKGGAVPKRVNSRKRDQSASAAA